MHANYLNPIPNGYVRSSFGFQTDLYIYFFFQDFLSQIVNYLTNLNLKNLQTVCLSFFFFSDECQRQQARKQQTVVSIMYVIVVCCTHTVNVLIGTCNATYLSSSTR